MLQKLGAKLMQSVGQRCTHIVYKNGLMSTLSKYRLLQEPKPLVVGIAWVVECAEQAKHADETKFLVNLDGVNVAGSNKRRRSMLPKHLTDLGPDPRAIVSPAQAGGSSNDNSLEMKSPSSDDAAANSSADSDLPPLERARRRHSSLFAAWGR
ncbi:hypothetical protein NM688_g7113 [Phlebia brevispora]|uniref:Uncharacterized protein n=1 Tax=Phlebia brevispora TaxID=194682 RepID=A0ACC1S978_9APHY|nr:hypothetical protein NM688_g7113 [Phlebia brevispora]